MLRITPETLTAAYEFLRALPPFAGMKLPPADEVEFRITRRTDEFGRYQWMGKRHRISISEKSSGNADTLLKSMAHEMNHLSLEQDGLESYRGGENTHNKHFKARAARICKVYGWDAKAFQ
jgi:hypothetical protein